MKKEIANIVLFLLLSCGAASVSCSDSDPWAPGLQPAANNQGVYFNKSNPRLAEASQETGSDQAVFTLLLGRDASKAGSAIEVPITVLYASTHLSIPKSITLESGSSSAELIIGVKEFEPGVKYEYSLEIDVNYADPYKLYDAGTSAAGSARFDGFVSVKPAPVLLATAKFTPTAGPSFVPFDQELWDNLDGSYSFKNFLCNNAGYSFDFTIDNAKNIRPLISSGYHDVSQNRWYFSSTNNSSSSYYLPCYIPGAPSDYVTYLYFYTAENTTSSQAFWIDLASKTGKMVGYSRYAIYSQGTITFDVLWN